MAVATREMRAGTPSATQAARPASTPRASAPAVQEAAPSVGQAAPTRPTRRRDYDAPASPWPLFLYLLLTFLLVNVAFVWAAVRAAGA
jgi:hypothetical protein